MALVTVAVLAAVTTCGVTVSAIVNSTVLGIAMLWVLLYGGGFALSLLPAHSRRRTAPDHLPHILRGNYDLQFLLRVVIWSALASLAVALAGFGYFSRRDI